MYDRVSCKFQSNNLLFRNRKKVWYHVTDGSGDRRYPPKLDNNDETYDQMY